MGSRFLCSFYLCIRKPALVFFRHTLFTTIPLHKPIILIITLTSSNHTLNWPITRFYPSALPTNPYDLDADDVNQTMYFANVRGSVGNMDIFQSFLISFASGGVDVSELGNPGGNGSGKSKSKSKLGFKGLFLYTAGVLFHVVCCIR